MRYAVRIYGGAAGAASRGVPYHDRRRATIGSAPTYASAQPAIGCSMLSARCFAKPSIAGSRSISHADGPLMYHTLVLTMPLSVGPQGRLGLVTFDRQHGTLVKRGENDGQTNARRRVGAARR